MIRLLPSRPNRLSASESPLVRGSSPDNRRTLTSLVAIHKARGAQRVPALTFSLTVCVQDFGVRDPLHVAVQVFIQLLTLAQLLELSTWPGLLSFFGELSRRRSKAGHVFAGPWPDETELRGGVVLPTENPQNQVENKKGTQQNERDKVKPGPLVSDGVIHLEVNTGVNIINGHPQRKLRGLGGRSLHRPSREPWSIPPWWCTGRLWAWRSRCCRSAWCRYWVPPSRAGTRSRWWRSGVRCRPERRVQAARLRLWSRYLCGKQTRALSVERIPWQLCVCSTTVLLVPV